MSKKLMVASATQAALLNQFLLVEIQTGFWKDQRPATHGQAWEGVSIEVAETNTVGPAGGFKPLRFYDFLNPEFTKIHEAKLVQIAQTIKPNMTFKALKKELIELARIIGGRMTDKTQEPARVFRGNNRTDFDVIRTVDRQKVMSVAGAKALVDGALKSVSKKTAVKKIMTSSAYGTMGTPVTDAVKTVKKTAVKAEEGVTVTTTSSGATVRKVAVKLIEAAEAV